MRAKIAAISFVVFGATAFGIAFTYYGTQSYLAALAVACVPAVIFWSWYWYLGYKLRREPPLRGDGLHYRAPPE
jgi:hypothetical protein